MAPRTLPAAVLLTALALPCPAWAALRYIPGCPPSSPVCAGYDSLEEALEESLPGDVLRVWSDLKFTQPVVVDVDVTIEGTDPDVQVGPLDVSAPGTFTLRGLTLACTPGATYSVRSVAPSTHLDQVRTAPCDEVLPVEVTGDSLLVEDATFTTQAGSPQASLRYTGPDLIVRGSTFAFLPQAIEVSPVHPGEVVQISLDGVHFLTVLGPALRVQDALLDVLIQEVTFDEVATDGSAALDFVTPRTGGPSSLTGAHIGARRGGAWLSWLDDGSPGTPSSTTLDLQDITLTESTAWTGAPLTARAGDLATTLARGWFCGNRGVTATDVDLAGSEVVATNLGFRGGATWSPDGTGASVGTVMGLDGHRNIDLRHLSVEADVAVAVRAISNDLDEIRMTSSWLDTDVRPLYVFPSTGVSVLVSHSALQGSTLDWSNAGAVVDNNQAILDPRFVDSPVFGAEGCDAVGLRLWPDSPLRGAADPSEADPDGTTADIGSWGGPGAALVDADDDGVWSDLDCDDSKPLFGWGKADLPYDGLDQDCDGADSVDVDGDGYVAGVDCDDAEPLAWPGGPDPWYDGIDGNCDGEDDFDQDGDGWRSGLGNGTDCDDEDDSLYPGAPELWYDGIDQSCDGNDLDQDGDGHLSMFDGGGEPVPGGDDCNDLVAAISPSAVEVWYDGVDQDCRGDDFDQDGDGYRSLDHEGDDCDDLNPEVHPGAVEDFDPIDLDCDGWGDPSGPVTPLGCDGCGGGQESAVGWGWWLAAALVWRRRGASRYPPRTGWRHESLAGPPTGC